MFPAQRSRRNSPGSRLPQSALMRPPTPFKEEKSHQSADYEPPKKDNLFLWTVFLLLLLGVTFSTWIGVYVIFGQPELPFSYKILRKFKRLDPPQRFKADVAPQGEFLSAEKLYNRYNNMYPVALREANRQMERSYLRNYPTTNQSAAYITGRFTIMDSFELRPADFFPSGVVALAASDDYPRLLIEHVYTTSASIAPLIKRNLLSGMPIELRRTYELTTVIHATKQADGRVLLTVVPLNYGGYVFKGTSGGFSLEPPSNLNVAAPWPLLSEDRRREANESFIAFRQRSGLGFLVSNTKGEGQKPVESALKGLDAPIVPDPTPTPSASSAQVAATNAAVTAKVPRRDVKPTPPAVVAAGTPGVKTTPAATPPVIAAAEPILRAVAVETPTPRRPATMLGAAPANGAGGVSLQPFMGPANNLAPGPGAAAIASGAHPWQTYAPGRMPGGKSIRLGDIASLSQQGGVGTDQPLYLNGQFVVRAVGENKLTGINNAVLRSTGPESNIRVIVAYPPDRPLPGEGSKINRDDSRPYQITDVKQTADGGFNVFAREIADP